MITKIKKVLKNKHGEGYIDVVVIVLAAVMVLSLILAVSPAMIAKIQLDNYADELLREAEIYGRIGSETTARAQVLTQRTGLSPEITWSRTGEVQINQEINVTCILYYDIGFGGFGNFKVKLVAKASGRSEKYWK